MYQCKHGKCKFDQRFTTKLPIDLIWFLKIPIEITVELMYKFDMDSHVFIKVPFSLCMTVSMFLDCLSNYLGVQ